MRMKLARIAALVGAVLLFGLTAAPASGRTASDVAASGGLGENALRDRLTRAERAWDAGDFVRALRIYEAVRRDAPRNNTNRALEHSIGACHYALQDYARALVAFENAYRFDPAQQRLIDACRTRLALEDSDEIDRERAAVPLWVWAILALLGQALGIRFAFRASAWSQRGLGLALAAGAIALSVHVLREFSERAETRFARVVTADARLHAAPHDSSAALGSITPGSKVRVLAKSRDWALVEHPDGRGWLERKAVALLLSR